VTFNGTGSSDSDNNLPLTYAWTFATGPREWRESDEDVCDEWDVPGDARGHGRLGLASAPASTSVTIVNVAPAVNAGADATLVLGTAFQLGASFTDPGGAADAPWGWTITWGDGAAQSGSAASPGAISATHTYAAAGTYNVQVSVTDKDGGTGSDQAAVTVQASAASQPGAHGQTRRAVRARRDCRFNGAASSDPDNNLPLTYALDLRRRRDGQRGNAQPHVRHGGELHRHAHRHGCVGPRERIGRDERHDRQRRAGGQRRRGRGRGARLAVQSECHLYRPGGATMRRGRGRSRGATAPTRPGAPVCSAGRSRRVTRSRRPVRTPCKSPSPIRTAAPAPTPRW